MDNVFLLATVCFFALFGVISLIKNIWTEFITQKNMYYIVITVKNKQDNVEELIRNTIWKHLNKISSIPKVYVVDNGSTDDTMSILRHLEKEYEFITVLTREEYIALMENDL